MSYKKKTENGRTYKGKSRGKKGFEPEVKFDRNCQSNHPSWYKTNEQLAKDTASIPFGYQLGARKDHGPYGDKFNDYAVAGIMRINYMPVYGHLDNITAPFNIASRNIYTYLKSVNSRAKTYDAPDIAIYLGAVDGLLSFHEWMKRLYGLMNTASVTNRYYAEAAVRACGGDYSDLLYNINDFRAYINRFALRMSTLPIPAELSIFARHAWLNAHVWYDSENPIKAQSYAFTPTGFWCYKLDRDGAGMLNFRRLFDIDGVDRSMENKEELNFVQIKTIGEELISAVLYGAGDEDFNIMGGDILYAYGESRIFRATTITEDYAVVPQYDSHVCDQINNLRAFGNPTTTESFKIVQDAEKRFLQHVVTVNLPTDVTLGSQLHINGVVYPWNDAVMDQYINIFDGDTSPDHVLVSTRLLNIPVAVGEDEDRYFQFLGIGSEYVCNYTLYYYATLSGNAADWQLYRSPLHKTVQTIFGLSGSGIEGPAVLDLNSANLGYADSVAQLSSFDRRPINYVAMMNIEPGSAMGEFEWVSNEYIPHANIDLNNYSIISYATLKQMNDTVLLAMFGIDEFGKQVSLGK